MSRLRNMSIGARVVLIAVVSLLGSLVCAIVAMSQVESAMVSARSAQTKAVVQTALGIADYYGKLEEQGKLPVGEAKASALAAIRGMRYGNNEYFWVNDMDLRMVMHPIKPEMNNTDVSNNKDAAGAPMFQMFRDAARSGGGFVSYVWPKPGAAEPQPNSPMWHSSHAGSGSSGRGYIPTTSPPTRGWLG